MATANRVQRLSIIFRFPGREGAPAGVGCSKVDSPALGRLTKRSEPPAAGGVQC